MTRTLHYLVTSADAQRTVAQIARQTLHLSAHQFSQAKFQDCVLLDGVPTHANVQTLAGQQLEIRLTEQAQDSIVPQDLAFSIVYEDEDLLIVDKPAPMASQSSDRQPMGTLANAVTYYYRAQPDFVYRPMNRLDKGTSGLMVIARNAHAQQRLQSQLHTPQFIREYLAVIHGAMDPEAGVIDAPIGKADGHTIRREVRADGKQAVTQYQTLWVRGAYSLLRLRLETGRTHQIRVHLSTMGYPIVGDFLYGTEDARLPGRFALHACLVQCEQPVTGRIIRLESSLPRALELGT